MNTNKTSDTDDNDFIHTEWSQPTGDGPEVAFNPITGEISSMENKTPSDGMTEMDRLASIQIESPVLKKPRADVGTHHLVGRYDFNFLCHWAEKGIEGHSLGYASRQAEVDELKAAVKVLRGACSRIEDHGGCSEYDPCSCSISIAQEALDATKGIGESTGREE